MRNKGLLITINILLVVVVLICFIGLKDYFYDMRANNCNDILNSEYGVSTDEVSSCIRFQNYPIYNYWLSYWMGVPIIIMLIFILEVLIGIIIEMDKINRSLL